MKLKLDDEKKENIKKRLEEYAINYANTSNPHKRFLKDLKGFDYLKSISEKYDVTLFDCIKFRRFYSERKIRFQREKQES